MPIEISTLASTTFAVLLFATINPPGSLGFVAHSLAANCYRIVAERHSKATTIKASRICIFPLISK
jgi:hypothetical protein